MWSDTIYIVLFIVGFFALLTSGAVLTIWLSKKRLSQETRPKYPEILDLLQTIEITNVALIRNKIVIDVMDIDSFPAETLQENGAKGISIVGSRVKFYIDGTAIDIENLFNEINQQFRGE